MHQPIFLFRRAILDEIEWKERLIGIIGARGVGKTTSLLQNLTETGTEDKSRLYVSLDNLANPYPTLISLADAFYLRGGRLLILDEIHKYNNWAAEIKHIYDVYPGLSLIFSGSAILRITDEGVDLSRRAVLYPLHGLSFREYLNVTQQKNFPVYSLEEILEHHPSIARNIVKELQPIP